MNWDLVLLLTSLMLFSYWINYVFGGPLSDDQNKVDVKAILFFVPNLLAILRLKKNNILTPMGANLIQELGMTSDPKTKMGLRKDSKRNIYLAGREFFTWERSLLCPICFHWWISVIAGALLLSFDLMGARTDLLLAIFTYLANHLIIRKIS